MGQKTAQSERKAKKVISRPETSNSNNMQPQTLLEPSSKALEK